MRQEQAPLLNKISHASKYLLPVLWMALLLCVLTLVLVSIGLVVSPNSSGADVITAPYVHTTPEQIMSGALTLRDKYVVVACLLVFSVLLLPGFWWGIRLLQLFRREQPFSAQSVLYARRIAWLFLAWIIIGKGSVLLTVVTPEGLNLAFNPYTALRDFILLGLAWLFAWLLEVGTSLHHDSELAI
jgi:hypothetical protein